MNKFVRKQIVFLLSGLLLTVLLISCQTVPNADSQTATPTATTTANNLPPVASPDGELSADAKLPPLPYDYAALGKAIDAETMRLHHDAHHASYVNNLNDALKQEPELRNRSIESILRDLDSVPENIRTKVRNNAGGHLNHTIFWQIMSPDGGGEPTGEIAQEINQTFGNFESFRRQFNEAGGGRFGSGWVWLVRNPAGGLEIVTTPNQDNPIMDGAYYPIMGNDVWEHAYYLRYRNRRGEYLNNWWNVVNWSEINRRSQASLQASN